MSQQIKQEIHRLREQISDLRYRYHVQNDPEVTDAMYDGLMDRLRKLEEEYPEFDTEHSPTKRIAGEPLKGFKKIKHEVRQWSFDDAFDRDDIEKWQKKIKKILTKTLEKKPTDLEYITELKIDGLHIVLTYKNGELASAATRGDGVVGEDVTQNVRTIHSIPLKLPTKETITIEGEVWMGAGMFEALNKKRKAQELPLYANPRNFAAGTLRQLDPSIVARRKLQITAYDITKGDIPDTQMSELQKIKKLGFRVDPYATVCKTIDEVMKVYHNWIDQKHSQEFWIDGLVVKVNQRKYQDALGYTGKSPRWAIALKFPAEQGTTRINEVHIQVGRTGVLTPVAVMDPVSLAGTTVTHATLHNFEEIERLDVKVGDTVVVEKAGDIIPKVVRVLKKMRTGQEKDIVVPTVCPVCHNTVQKERDSVAVFCVNPSCEATSLQHIIHFVSKKGYNIDGLGKKIVQQLLNNKIITDAADIFSLTKENLLQLDGFAELSAKNLIDAIGNAKHISFARFIYALGIRHVGEETANTLAKEFNSLKQLQEANQEQLIQIPDIGERVAESIMDYMVNPEHIELLTKLLDRGVSIQHGSNLSSSNILNGNTFVLTGTLPTWSRDQAKEEIKKAGGSVSSSVSKKTDYLVSGKASGSKLKKAEALGVSVIDEKQLKQLLKK